MCVEEIKKEESSIIPLTTTTTIVATPPVQEIRYQANHHYVNAPATVAAAPPPMPIMGYVPAPASYPLDPSAAVYNQSIPYQAVSFINSVTKTLPELQFDTISLFHSIKLYLSLSLSSTTKYLHFQPP